MFGQEIEDQPDPAAGAQFAVGGQPGWDRDALEAGPGVLHPGCLACHGFHDNAEAETLARSLREELTGIQYGRVEDRYGWLTRLDG